MRSELGARVGRDADRHRRAAPGRVRLADEDVRHAGDAQVVGQPDELLLGIDREHDGEGAFRQVARRALAGGVDDLRRGYPSREVFADDDVVGERV